MFNVHMDYDISINLIFNHIILQIESDELDKKIIEVVLPDNNMKTEIFPQLIQKNMRYKCSITLCTFTGMTEGILREHITIIHPTCRYYM